MRHIILFFLLLVALIPTRAQFSEVKKVPNIRRNDAPASSEVYVLTNANTQFVIRSNGVISDSYPIQTTYDDVSVMFSGGFMMSGKTDGQIWSNAMASASRIVDYIDGTIGDTSSAFYIVESSDPPFGESWQNWSNAVAKGAYFYDGDGDGVYNPVDLNGNGQWDENEDCPDILGDVTVWTVYNDGVPAADRRYTDVSPQGIEIRQTVWTKYGDDLNKNVYCIRYSIVNRGTVADTLKDVYFGLWADNDVGDYSDDLTGCSIQKQSGYTYNYGDDVQFAGSAPVVMTTLLQGPYRYTGNSDDEATNNMGELLGIRRISGAVNDTVTAFIHYMNSHPTQGDPDTKVEARNYLLGLTRQGEVVDPCNWQYGEVFGEDCSTIDGHFMYSGNPYDSLGWLNTSARDQRQMLSTGPFELIKDQPVDIIAAYHFSKGETSTESVILGLAKAEELLNNFRPNGVDERNENNLADKFDLEQNYPNPFNPTTTISYVIASPDLSGRGNLSNGQRQIASSQAPRNDGTVQVSLKVYDILGREVATLVNKKQTPGKYSVQFNGRSLASGVYFYTLKVGDFVQTQKMVLMK